MIIRIKIIIDSDVVAFQLRNSLSAHTALSINITVDYRVNMSRMPAQPQTGQGPNFNDGSAPAGRSASQGGRNSMPTWKGGGKGRGSQSGSVPATPAQWYHQTGQPHYGAGPRSANAQLTRMPSPPARPLGSMPTQQGPNGPDTNSRTNVPTGSSSWRSPGPIERQMMEVIEEKVADAVGECRQWLKPSDAFPGMHQNIALKLEAILRCSLPPGTPFTRLEQDSLKINLENQKY